jgi:hypothetical protein
MKFTGVLPILAIAGVAQSATMIMDIVSFQPSKGCSVD